YNSDVKASTGTAEVKDGKLVWKGDLPVGGKATITYSVTVTGGGDSRLHNVVTTDDKSGTCDTEKGCETDHVYGSYVFSKSSDPKPGTAVKKGDKVTYTVTVAQNGAGDVKDATITDDLSKVLDDAAYNDDAKASSGDVSVSDGKLVWKGNLPVGGKATITYSVTITGGGDGRLHNVVTTDDKSGTCDTEKSCETDHTVPPGKTPPPSTNVPPSGNTPPSGNVPPPNNPQLAPQSSGILARTGATVLFVAALGTLLILGGLSLAVAFRRRQRHNN
ncbi:hypothetical protein ACFC79_33095, partial [Streptomyces sp. NPDC056061]